ncbi:hypothetical protein COL940_000065 [Colletotrichum noveboracense]|nr:hypothetical protein COL940_000065 [Colletotrichum noveboracense]KAJ0294164.1 hypothetical protein CBS470a_001064 [Colletotrichum nupharicola]
MDSMRSLNTSLPGASAGKQAAQNDSPEQLLDAFKNAALSVTKLYKASAAAQSKARMDGYQDCLDDLLAFLDKERIGLGNGDGRRIRSWATERLEGRENSQNAESDDEADKPETTSSPNLNHSNSETQLQEETQMRTDSTSPAAPQPAQEEPKIMPITVPSQDTFTFQSAHAWPPQPPQQDAYLNLANLDLSDSSRTHDGANANPASRTSRPRHPANIPRSASRQGNNLGRGAGSKRKINFAEIFDLSSLDKNMFGGGPKRSRHT